MRTKGLRQTLRELCRLGTAGRARIDIVLNKAGSDAGTDLRSFLANAPQTGLVRLRRAIDAGKVINQAFTRPGGAGCLAYFAYSVHSNEELWAKDFSDDFLKVVSRVIRRFDFSELSLGTVKLALEREFERRVAVKVTLSEPAAEEHEAEELCLSA